MMNVFTLKIKWVLDIVCLIIRHNILHIPEGGYTKHKTLLEVEN